MSNKKNKKITAIIMLILVIIFLIYMIHPFLKAIVFGLIFAFLFYPLHIKIKNKIKYNLSSTLITIFIIFSIFFIIISVVTGLIFNQIGDININVETIKEIEVMMEKYLGFEVILVESIENYKDTFIEDITGKTTTFISVSFSFFTSLLVFFFVLFYGLLQKDIFLKTAYIILPFSQKKSEELILQSGFAIKALIIGQILTAIVQGTLGMISFYIAGIPGVLIWGLIMIIFSILPVVGAFLIWLPAGIFLLLKGEIIMGTFILLWGALVVSQIDNIIRPKLVNKYFKLHPLLIILGVFAGIALFGIIGLILGPLLFAFFILFFKAFKEEYELKGKNEIFKSQKS